MEANPDSCISRIYGAYRLQIYGNALHFFVMNNIFLNAEGLAMNEKYDIKVRELSPLARMLSLHQFHFFQ